MALPKEPRQKMINIMYLVLTALLAINISAEILNAFKTINNSLEKTNGQVFGSTAAIMNSLKEKATQAETAQKAGEWLPKATAASAEADKAYKFIEDLKKELITQATSGGKLKEDDQNVTTRLLVKSGKGDELKRILEEYKKKVLAIDPKIQTEFATSFQVNTDKPEGTDKKKDWKESYFYMSPTVGALSILSKFQNDIRTSENKVVTFCHEQVGKVELKFDSFEAIVGQSSNYLMPGEELEITAGLGAYSKTKLPTVSINGGGVGLNEKGQAVYKTKVGGAGTYTINVNVAFTDQDGKPQTRTIPVEYTVGTPGGASVGLDKMNVFYVGVDNPITIASSTGWDKTKVSISGGGGQLVSSGGAGKYNVRVSSVTDDCMITVTADGKPSSFKYRVRTVPMAQAYVGGFPSGENVPANTFKAQGGVGAGIKDFPFELKYTVASFVISTDSDDGDIVEASVQGNAFNANAQNLIRQHVKAGKTVYVDNIRVIGPDGQNKKVPSLVYYIR